MKHLGDEIYSNKSQPKSYEFTPDINDAKSRVLKTSSVKTYFLVIIISIHMIFSKNVPQK
jgi:hypothetical protein